MITVSTLFPGPYQHRIEYLPGAGPIYYTLIRIISDITVIESWRVSGGSAVATSRVGSVACSSSVLENKPARIIGRGMI